jgi:hypothetical protein
MLSSLAGQNKAYLLLREMIKKDFRDIWTEECIAYFSKQVDWEKLYPLSPTDFPQSFKSFAKRSMSQRQLVSRQRKIDEFSKFLSQIIVDSQDIRVFRAVIAVCYPEIKRAIDRVPKGEVMRHARNLAADELRKKGDAAIQSLFANWDQLTYTACMAEENDIAVALSSSISAELHSESWGLDQSYRDFLVVSSLQEFERRAGQKRKGRAGDDLQKAVSLIFEYLNLDYEDDPKLVTGTLEADLILKGKKGWNAVVSCKRTGRERVKQVSVSQTELYQNRITKVIWFFTDFDQTENRVFDMGARGSIFYLPDDSEAYIRLSANPSAAQYIRPLSGIRHSINEFLSP